MKKLRILSALLAILTAFSCLSSTSVFAAETNKLSITDIPDDIFYAELEDILYGITLQLPDGSTFTSNIDDVYSTDCYDVRNTVGLASTYCYYEIDGVELYLEAELYTCDFIGLSAYVYDPNNDESYTDYCTLPYPSDCEIPEVFCQDYVVYRQNGDDTLTVINYLGYEEYDENDNIVYPSIVIPESVNEMTVTAIANNAFAVTSHPAEITIPDTVTSIGSYALGYCFDVYGQGEIHGLPDSISSSILAYELMEADVDEEFLVSINIYNDNNAEYADYLKNTYFADNADFTYDEEYESILVTATKSQILSVAEEDELYINLVYDTVYKIEDELYYVMDRVSDNELIPISIITAAYTEDEAEAIKDNIINNYFDADTEYVFDGFDVIYIDATKAQLDALKYDDDISYIYLWNTMSLSSSLCRAIYFADDNDTFDIYLLESDAEYWDLSIDELHKTYFENCKGEYYFSSYETYYVIYGATKEQIVQLGNDDVAFISLFDEPALNKYYNLTIYGTTGSVAEEYALANDIAFVGNAPEHQLGDVNLDGVISVADATLIMKSNVGLEELTDYQLELADYDGNGAVNVMDATEIQKKIAGY